MQLRPQWLRQKLRLTCCSKTTSASPLPRSTGAGRRSACVRWRDFGASSRGLLATFLVAIVPVWSGNIKATTLPENDVAAFIVNVARYTSWPKAAPLESLTVCYAHGGAEPAAASISASDWIVKGMPVHWLRISSPQQVAGCNIVWVNADAHPAPRAWIAAIADQPILTLSNYADFTADGGIIGAYRVGPDWRFEVNLEALQRSRINIAAVALRLSQKQRASDTRGQTR